MIDKFSGEYRWLSNMWKASICTTHSGVEYIWKSTEHFYQACKCKHSYDRETIYEMDSPYDTKKYARNVEMIDDWDKKKYQIMYIATRLKYTQNPDLLKKLIDTGTQEIIEGNTWHDDYWGSCSCNNCSCLMGKNKLGEILMKVRDQYI